MDRDIEVWKGVNSDGDTVTVWRSKSGDFPIAFRDDEEGYAGATVIPKEAFAKALTEAYNAGLEAAAGVCGEPHGTGVCSCDVCETVRKRARAIRALKENP